MFKLQPYAKITKKFGTKLRVETVDITFEIIYEPVMLEFKKYQKDVLFHRVNVV